MKIKFEKDLVDKEVIESMSEGVEELRPMDVFGTVGLSIEKFIDVGKLFEYYDVEDMTQMLIKLDNILLPDLTKDFELLAKYQKIDGIEDITNTSVSDITKKYFEIRTAINTVLEIRRRYSAYKDNWIELTTFINNLYKRKKGSKMLSSTLKEYKNQDLREAKVDEWLSQLVKERDRMVIAMLRINQFMDEINFTIKYLQDINTEVSRIQSAIVLALDTGEISKVNWRNN